MEYQHFVCQHLSMFVGMRVARNILSVVLAFAVGSTTMFLLHDLHMSIWPEETMPAATS